MWARLLITPVLAEKNSVVTYVVALPFAFCRRACVYISMPVPGSVLQPSLVPSVNVFDG